MRKQKGQSLFVSIGLAIYVILTGIDRFIHKLPDALYITVALVGIVLILIGFVQSRRKKQP